MNIIIYLVLPTEKNKLWYADLVGKHLSEEKFARVLFNCFLDVRAIPFAVRLPYAD